MYRFILLLLALLFAGCSDKPSKPSEDTPKFGLSFTSPDANLQTVLAKAVATVVPVDFEMGILPGTRDYPFLLDNNSTIPLTNIVVASSNPKFIPSPSFIRTLGAPGEEVGSSVLVQVLARHGLSESGSGVLIDLITEADDTTTISISGDFGDTTFAVTYTMRVTPAYVTFPAGSGDDGAIGVNCPVYFKDPTTLEFVIRDTVPAGAKPLYFECVGDNSQKSSVRGKELVELYVAY